LRDEAYGILSSFARATVYTGYTVFTGLWIYMYKRFLKGLGLVWLHRFISMFELINARTSPTLLPKKKSLPSLDGNFVPRGVNFVDVG
jgi:hypothetical protein